ncbi:hypothetical protein DL766_009950 [Monosporascus sp. MC13-8B]|uniref:DUF7735 domain-containing protein n=1 Tax=Monosporascus cannonballus TaxID=155416 RepID=A0ABY0GSN7_9PEZI|nr:hypothetical protein DL762_009809 [Monosporascus cannonballus]RYO78996.1 hypothetical protein DL763_009450 [Monosporascus cannonballus]RYP12511.1 hypothetical protein DL766_009950 [Monosporascus sp. MC13-8B]
MPSLDEITYSRDATVAAVRDYYDFLTKMYVRESDIIEPPAGGWPTIKPYLECMGKTDEVLSLLCHLPYIRELDDINKIQGAPWCYFADWQKLGQEANLRQVKGETLRLLSERAGIIDDVPPHVVGLTCGGRNNPVILLDTKLGIIHWYECPHEIKLAPARELLQDDAYDYAPENEAVWMAECGSWAITDFFEVLKDEFRKLHFIPKNQRLVVDIYTTFPRSHEVIPVMQDVYWRHGWPDLQRYLTKMKTAALLTFAATAAHASVMQIPAMPRQVPTKTEGPASTQSPDPWVCATKNMTEYFDMPKPTGTLLDAIDAYVDKQLEPCWSTAIGRDKLSCEVTGSLWCGFSTDAPPSASAAYSSVASECPITWERYEPIEQSWLNITIAHAECYADAHRGKGTTSSASSATGLTAVPGTGATAAEPTPTNNVLGRAEGVDMWMLAGTGIAVAVINSAM